MFVRHFIFLIINIFVNISALTIKRCCPPNYELSPDFMCVTSKKKVQETANDWSWFPIHSVINSNTYSFYKEEELSELKLKLNNITVENEMHICQVWDEPGLIVNTERDRHFFVVLGNDDEQSGVYINEDVTNVKMSHLQHNLNNSWLMPFTDMCFQKLRQNYFAIFFCPSGKIPWIPKCCSSRHLYNSSLNDCQSVHEDSQILDWRLHSHFKIERYYVNSHTNILPDCKKPSILRTVKKAWNCRGFELAETKILPSGALKIKNKTLTTTEYCGEKTWHEGNIVLNNFFLCSIAPTLGTKTVSYGVLFIIGGFCLLFTVLISMWLPELRQNLYNHIALTHNTILMLAYFSWGTSKFVTLETFGCTILCSIIQFTFVGSLFWMNAMCIEISSTLRKSRTAPRASKRRYIKYSAYAWGFTVVISVTTLTMEFMEKPPLNLPRPGFSCFCDFSRETISIFIYFYGPMAILLVFNTILFIFTAWKIMSTFRQTAILRQADSATASANQIDKHRLIIYTKLFLLMGIPWITEIVGWAVEGRGWFWMLLDVINLLRAVLIFVLFICNRAVLESIKSRLSVAASVYFSQSTNSTADTVRVENMRDSLEARQREVQNWNKHCNAARLTAEMEMT